MDNIENTEHIIQSSKGFKPFDDCSVEADYYIENGLLVFTESYHLKRGNCCKNSCRHCPYGYEKKK